MTNFFRRFVVGALAALLCVQAVAAEEGLSRQIQELKQGVLNLNRDLTVLEGELLYPSSHTAVLVSVDVGSPIRLVDVNLTLDGKHVGYHFYTEQEFAALSKGGIHRLFEGNITSGKHTLEATITGAGDGPRADDVPGDLSPDWGLHLVDINLVMGDVVRNVAAQAEAFAGG